jgi:hypothetical protein
VTDYLKARLAWPWKENERKVQKEREERKTEKNFNIFVSLKL